MKIAVIGSGISGIVSAYYLDQAKHHVVLYEANDRLGGHTDTHRVEVDKRSYYIDTGFIVFNYANYPFFSRFLDELGVTSQASEMSFSVSNTRSGLQYNATDLDTLFCQRRNLLRPRFYRMLIDLLRFYRQSPALLKATDNALSLGDYLTRNGYSDAFIEDHILPMACALWSAAPSEIRNFPARYFVAFMHNHNMLQIHNRPLWRTVQGGSWRYINAFQRRFKGKLRLPQPVVGIEREQHGVRVKLGDGSAQWYDKVFICCHSDQALALLTQPSAAETEILGAIRYQPNDVVLHSDARLMPTHPKAWASWNALQGSEASDRCTVTYCMNRLQNLRAPVDFLVTLNATQLIDPDKVWVKRRYHHPIYDHACVQAQARRQEINGARHTYYCGAYWGWGFHEDGARSAIEAVESLCRETQRDAA